MSADRQTDRQTATESNTCNNMSWVTVSITFSRSNVAADCRRPPRRLHAGFIPTVTQIQTYTHTDRQTDKRNRQTDRQTDKREQETTQTLACWINCPYNRHTHIHTDRQTDKRNRQTDRQTGDHPRLPVMHSKWQMCTGQFHLQVGSGRSLCC